MNKKTYMRLSGITALVALCLCACGKTEESTQTTTAVSEDTATTTTAVAETTPEAPADAALYLVEYGKTTYSVVRADEPSAAIAGSASNLYQKIKDKTGVAMKLTTDWYSPREENPDLSGPEILIGVTNRPETAEVLESLPENSYAIVIRNNKLVIVGKTNALTELALYTFEEKILNNTDKCREGYLRFDEADNTTVTLDKPFTLGEMIKSGYKLSVDSVKIAHTQKQGQYGIGQGSASDGTYVYFVLRNSNDTGSVITKHRMDDGSLVGVSEVLKLGHGNDMTYDSKNHRLVVAHGHSEGQILTLVDPDTLALIKDIGIPKGSGAIAYCASKDLYAISQGGSTLHILDGNFKWVASYSRTDKTGYTAQGMGCDDDYVYFPMSGSKDNVLVIYDWSGNYVATVNVPMSQESESMFWVNGKYYIAYNASGEAVYETTFEIIFE
jgi:hypothetical protein